MLYTRAVLIVIAAAVPAAWGARFSSHISVMTPTSSFSHGVGDLRSGGNDLRSGFNDPRGRRFLQTQGSETVSRFSNVPLEDSRFGYPRVRPAIPFNFEEKANYFPRKQAARQFVDNSGAVLIPLLPLSPYRVDSPNPESLWPEGLFLPPRPPHAPPQLSRADEETAESNSVYDPYLLEGPEAIAAVRKAQDHGLLYFHDIPHIRSLLDNQQLREANQLKPHKLASIRQTWPYNRP